MFPAKCIIHALKVRRAANGCHGATTPSDKRPLIVHADRDHVLSCCEFHEFITEGNARWGQRNSLSSRNIAITRLH